MKLHNDKDEFRAAVSAAAKNFKMPEHVIEKDYWVTKLLFNVFKYQYSNLVIFKGGTSLSKGHKLISRFSEDVDLALHPDAFKKGIIDKREGDALYTVLTKIKDLNFTDEKVGKESEKQRYKRVYSFPQSFDYPKDSVIHGKIVVEINSFSTPFPVEKVVIQSLVAEYLQVTYGDEELKKLELEPFEIDALAPERACCEKLLALRRASHKGGQFLSERIRHVYDIHQLYNSERIIIWIKKENNFFEMLHNCYEDDQLNQKISNEVAHNFKSFSIFHDPITTLKSVKTSYDGLRNITFDNSLPSIEEAGLTLTKINELLIGFEFIK